MRVLWISHFIPYPPKSGVHLRSYYLLRGVAARHEVDLVCFVQEVWLHVFYSSPQIGLEDCRRALLEFCRSVTFIPIESVSRPGGRIRTALEAVIVDPSYTLRWLQGGSAREALTRVARERYDVVHFDTVGLAPYRQLFPNTPATLGHHNIESHMLLRRAEKEANPLKRWYFRQEGRRVASYEARIAETFAAHITCSDLDSQRLKAIAPSATAISIPNGVDVQYFRNTSVSTARPQSIIFVGSLNWYPNVEAVLFLLREVWPLIKAKVPGLRVDIVGSAPPQVVLKTAAGLDGVRVHGFVDDVRPFLEAATLYVCPIRDGGGTKLKILDAFAMEKCVIAHPIACEGIDITPGRDVELAEDARAFADAIRRLLADAATRESRGRAARALVVERYSFRTSGSV